MPFAARRRPKSSLTSRKSADLNSRLRAPIDSLRGLRYPVRTDFVSGPSIENHRPDASSYLSQHRADCRHGHCAFLRVPTDQHRASQMELSLLLWTDAGSRVDHPRPCRRSGSILLGLLEGDATLEIGTFGKAQDMSWMDYFYFLLVNFTTLGRGELVPTDHLRFLAAIEAFVGFLMITASGSYVLQVMAGKPPGSGSLLEPIGRPWIARHPRDSGRALIRTSTPGFPSVGIRAPSVNDSAATAQTGDASLVRGTQIPAFAGTSGRGA